MKNPLLPRVGFVVALAALAGVAAHGGCFARRLRVGTFNIEQFGKSPTTDVRRVAALIAETEADVLAVQEIQSEERARELVALLPRRFELALSKCGGSSKMRVGYLYDPERVRLVATREHQDLAPEPSDSCAPERPGLAARFARVDTGREFQLLVFHLVPGHEPKQQDRRREQWRRAHAIAARADVPVAILGDANSTGFLDDAGAERSFILAEAARAHLDVVTTPLGCSEYWRPKRDTDLEPSLLDHVVATPGLTRSAPKLWGYCAALACQPTRTAPPDFDKVSDHCPVTVDL